MRPPELFAAWIASLALVACSAEPTLHPGPDQRPHREATVSHIESTPVDRRLPLDREVPSRFETATFALG